MLFYILSAKLVYGQSLLSQEGDIVNLERLLEFRDEDLIGARGLSKESIFDEKFNEATFESLLDFQDNLNLMERRRTEEAVELGITDSFTSESGFDTTTMLPEMLRFYLNEYSFDMIPSKVKVRQMLQSGCWCQIMNFNRGKGEAYDAFDSFCKEWQHCKNCVQRDGCEYHDMFRTADSRQGKQLGPFLATPDASSYSYKVNWSKKQNRFTCKLIKDDCAKHSCMCDEALAYSLAQAEDLFNEKNSEENGFETNGVCEWKQTGKMDLFCCGEYPHRFPHPVFWNNRERCCVDNKISRDCPAGQN